MSSTHPESRGGAPSIKKTKNHVHSQRILKNSYIQVIKPTQQIKPQLELNLWIYNPTFG